jgi:hypothetical protein
MDTRSRSGRISDGFGAEMVISGGFLVDLVGRHGRRLSAEVTIWDTSRLRLIGLLSLLYL